MAKTTKVVRKVVKKQAVNLKPLKIEAPKITDSEKEERRLASVPTQIKKKSIKEEELTQNSSISLRQAILISEVIGAPKCKTRHRRGYR